MSAIRGLARTALRPDARRLFAHDLRRSLGGEPPLPSAPIRRVAVVCAGNLCRSPFAAALLARLRPGLGVASFGLSAAAGGAADPRAVALAREWDLDLSRHRTRCLGDADVRSADLLLAMDAAQLRALARRWPAARARQRILGDFLPARPFAIADPWGRSETCWREAYARIALAVRRLAERLAAGG